jgi:hypothetical protein
MTQPRWRWTDEASRISEFDAGSSKFVEMAYTLKANGHDDCLFAATADLHAATYRAPPQLQAFDDTAAER